MIFTVFTHAGAIYDTSLTIIVFVLRNTSRLYTSIMPCRHFHVPVLFAIFAISVATLVAQGVTKEQVDGISTFARLDTTIACGGATSVDAVPELKKMGFRSVINVRRTSEAGADVEAEGTAVKAAGMKYIHLPFDPQSPDPMLIDNFIAAVTAPDNQPAYIHCAAGGRAAALWMIKRWKADGWDETRALEEAVALGLNERFQPFALNYIRTHTR
jgi:uncharacterized protein (TIGR01244 family)